MVGAVSSAHDELTGRSRPVGDGVSWVVQDASVVRT